MEPEPLLPGAAVSVGVLIGERRKEGRAEIVVREIHLEPLETGGVRTTRRIGVGPMNVLNFDDGQLPDGQCVSPAMRNGRRTADLPPLRIIRRQLLLAVPWLLLAAAAAGVAELDGGDGAHILDEAGYPLQAGDVSVVPDAGTADACSTIGLDQGDNAPVSELATFAYTTAQNALLSKVSRQKLPIGDASTLYWAEADAADTALSAEAAAQMLFFAPSTTADTDTSETARLRRGVMDLIAKGRPLESPELRLDPGTRFYILGLAPNAARLSVRFWKRRRSMRSARHSTSIGRIC